MIKLGEILNVCGNHLYVCVEFVDGCAVFGHPSTLINALDDDELNFEVTFLAELADQFDLMIYVK